MTRCILLMLLVLTAIAAERRPGVVTFSDGTTWTGDIALASGAKLQLHDGTAVRILDPATVAELRFAPEKESMERAFAMPEPGKPIRVETGEAYPLRYLAAQVLLTSDTRIAGHLYATGLTVDVPTADVDEPERRKLPLPAKQRGKPGQRLDQLVYVSRIVFSAANGSDAQRQHIVVSGGADELGAAAWDGLVPLEVRADDAGFAVATPLGSTVLWAARRGERAALGWPADDSALTARITALLPAIDDFFDGKEALAARQEGDDVFSLMRLTRIARTTDGPNRPWHIEVWRWRLDGDRALIAGRVALLRGRSGAPPAVQLMPAWATVQAVDGRTTLEGWP